MRKSNLRVAAFAIATLLFCGTISAVTGVLEQYHSVLNSLLGQFVVDDESFAGLQSYVTTRVDYKKLSAAKQWPNCMEALIRADNAKIKTASLNERKAFWINTYNALVLDSVAKHYPPIGHSANYPDISVQNIRGMWTAPHPVAGASYSLDQIEITLRDMNDPLVIFAICKGGHNSPPLMHRVYVADEINDQLKSSFGNFCSIPANVTLDKVANLLRLSSVFQQYESDFWHPVDVKIPPELNAYPSADRAMLTYIVNTIATEDRRYILSKSPRISYATFDWSLNDKQVK